jgi:hypothetical protein
MIVALGGVSVFFIPTPNLNLTPNLILTITPILNPHTNPHSQSTPPPPVPPPQHDNLVPTMTSPLSIHAC